MKFMNKRHLLHLTGIIIVAFWLVMMVMLVRKQKSTGTASEQISVGEAAEIDSIQKEWKEIFLKDRKVGYSLSFIRPFKDGYFMQDEVFLRLNLMGLDRAIYTITQTNADKNFIMKDFVFKMNSGVVSYNISGRVEGNRLLIKTGDTGDRDVRELILSEPPVISAGMEHLFKTRKMQVGESFRTSFFDPSTLAQKEAVFRVAATESLEINRIKYDTFRIETEMWNNPVIIWVDESGSVLKEKGAMGLVMIRSGAANASLDIEGSDDYYEMASVPVDRSLPPDPERLAYLKVRLNLTGGTLPLSIPDKTERQSLDKDIMMIRLEKIPSALSGETNYDMDESLSPYLKPEFNIESDSAEITAKAASIAGYEKSPALKAGRLLNWVYSNIDKKPVVSVPSALEVLKTRVGDCNEHATLLTALLRASGIPARLSVGLVYSRGRFYYHAWTEAYLGRWISMDATLNQMPVDVTHICLIYGNLDKQVEIIGLIGRLNFEVLDLGYN